MTSTLVKKSSQKKHYLLINIAKQSLDVFEKNSTTPIAHYPISSSRFGLGSELESYRTPLGKFVIDEKFGANAPERMSFKAREATGKIVSLGGDEDLVLTRILTLSGSEPHNANTQERFIYIHGTNQESLIGTPASHGCIRLRNADVIELFEIVNERDEVEIVKE